MNFSLTESRIKLSTLKLCLIGLCSFLIAFKLLDDTLLYDNFKYINNYVVIFISCLIILFCKSKQKNKHTSIFILLLLSIIISTFIRGESEYYISNCITIIALYIIYSLNDKEYVSAVYGIVLAVLPYISDWLLTFIKTGAYLGNRGPIHFTVIGFLLVTVLFRSKNRKKIVFFLLSFNIIVSFLGSSRTSLLCNCGCLFLAILTYLQGRLTVKKLFRIFIIGIGVSTILVYLQNKIADLMINKWNNNQISMISGREKMWMNAFTNFKMWGFSSDYTQILYGVGNIHNGYVQAFISFGVITGVLYVIWTMSIFVLGFKHRKNRDMQCMLLAYLPVTVLSMFESTFIMEKGYPLLGICTVLICGQIARKTWEIDYVNK